MPSSSPSLLKPHPLVTRLNALLSHAGLPRAVRTIDEITSNSSSLLVASFETVFSSTIADIRRRPGATLSNGGGGGSAAADHAFNAQRVIDSLSALLPPRISIPPTVTGVSIASGDLSALAFLISILDKASHALTDANPSTPKITDSKSPSMIVTSALASLGEAVFTAASAAADEVRNIPITTSAATSSSSSNKVAPHDNSWLSHSEGGGGGGDAATTTASDIWSSTTPSKVRERAAMKSALVGGNAPPRSSAQPPQPPPSSPRSLAATATAEYNAQRAGPGGEGLLAADMKAEDDHRRAEAAKLAERRAKGLMSRLAHSAAEEMSQIQAMTKVAIRNREVELRAIEARALAAATSRAKAAKHERKVLTMRTKLVVENLSRQTLSMRIARSSRQATATSTLLKALAGQARLGAADKLKAAAAERSGMLVDASSRVAWLNHTSQILNEVMLEETARQVAQRQAATRSQKEALDRAIREMSLDEDALLLRMQDEQAHAEESFFNTHIEPMEMKTGSGDASRIAKERVTDITDTDNDAARVGTLARAHRVLSEGGRKMGASRAAANQTIKLIAKDIGGEIADAEGLESHGNRLTQQS